MRSLKCSSQFPEALGIMTLWAALCYLSPYFLTVPEKCQPPKTWLPFLSPTPSALSSSVPRGLHPTVSAPTPLCVLFPLPSFPFLSAHVPQFDLLLYIVWLCNGRSLESPQREHSICQLLPSLPGPQPSPLPPLPFPWAVSKRAGEDVGKLPLPHFFPPPPHLLVSFPLLSTILLRLDCCRPCKGCLWSRRSQWEVQSGEGALRPLDPTGKLDAI